MHHMPCMSIIAPVRADRLVVSAMLSLTKVLTVM